MWTKLTLALLLLPSTILGQAKDNDLSTPHAAGFSFAAALISGDAAVAKQIYAGGDEAAMKVIDAYAETANSYRAMARLVEERFGGKGLPLFERMRLDLLKAAGLVACFSNEPTTEEGGEVAVFEAQGGQHIRLKRTEGKWKIVGLPFTGQLQLDELALIKRIYDSVARKVKDGKYASAYDAYKALEAVMSLPNPDLTPKELRERLDLDAPPRR